MQSTSSHIVASNRSPKEDIAIVGMACLFPKAPDVRTYWQNIIDKVDAVGDPPADWEAELYYDPASDANDRIYCKRGGYLGDLARFDPLSYGVMPTSIDGGEPDQFLALKVAHEALADAGCLDGALDRTRVEVVIGRGTYINRGFTTVLQHGVVVDRVLHILKQLHPEHTDEELHVLKRELKASLPPFNAEMAPALVPNVMSGRIANRLDLMGPNYTVDAACASSLVAVDQGMQDLLNGRCDLALVGGVHASTPAPILMIFCQLNALSRSGQMRPFDRKADGTLLGEGLGFIVLKRRADAERDGDRIYALLKGIGTASDGRALGLLAPRVEGEALALRRAYDAAGVDPDSIGLIEAHGTGTSVGDAAEIEALRSVFGSDDTSRPPCAVGTVKSMISHLIPAAGIAGLIKTALALYHKVLPPTLHCDEPNPELALSTTPFYINTATRPWIHGAPTPRRAGVNAFGFGGINAHAILEEHQELSEAGQPRLQHLWETEAFLLHADSREALITRAEQIRNYAAGTPALVLKDLAYTLNTTLRDAPYRLGFVADTPEALIEKLDRALERLSDSGCARIQDPQGIYFFEEPLGRQGTLAFLFPGEGSQYPHMLDDLCIHFPEVRAWFDLLDRAFAGKRHRLPSQIIFPPPGTDAEAEDGLWQMDYGPEAIFAANQALYSLLQSLRIDPDAVVGHSTGEYSALVAAGASPIEPRERLVGDMVALNELYQRISAQGDIEEGVLLTVGGADPALVRTLIHRSKAQLHLAMDNCPHQMVVFGTEEAVRQAREVLQREGAICAPLPFGRAYHTPLFEPFCRKLEEFFETLEIRAPERTLYSCATARPYPPEPEAVRRQAVDQWARPVRFRETIQAMYEDGVRIFVEVGPRNNLTAFVNDILRGEPHLAIASNAPRRTGITQLNHLVAMLGAHGEPLQLDALYARRSPRHLRLDEPRTSDLNASARSMKLATGLQPLRLSRNRTNGAQEPPGPASRSETARQPGSPEPPPPARSQAPPPPARRERPTLDRDASADLPEHSDDRAAVMSQYMETMERYLNLQRDVMGAFLEAPPDRPRSEPGLPPHEAGGHAPGPPTHEAEDPGRSAARDVADESAGGDGVAQLSRNGHSAANASPGQETGRSASIGEILLQLVSERTGYPVEMLDPSMDLEAELSIDSIKRVEILGAFRKRTGLLQSQDMDRVTAMRTLQQITDFLEARDEPASDARLSEKDAPATADHTSALPFIGTVTARDSGGELVALRELDVEEDLFLLDHTLGRDVSRKDETLRALPVVPLTISMEMMAEAAVALVRNSVIVGMKDVRAYRWITLDEGRCTLQLTARRKGDSASEVEVRIQEFAGDPDVRADVPLIEGTVLLAADYPEAPRAGDFPLQSERPSRWQPEELYDRVMFHGPLLQGVASVDRWGSDGTEGTLHGLDAAGFFRSTTDPVFLIDPVVLDATGQLIGYWTAEHMEHGFHVFPFRLETLHLYGPGVAMGERVTCRARIELVGDEQIRSDIDVVGANGRLLSRLEGWWDRRFHLPDPLYRLRAAPAEHLVSSPWAAPPASISNPESCTCCLLDMLPPDFLEAHGRIWQRVLAHIILSRREREIFQNLRGPERRRTEWLLGRAAAKDAVRLFLKRRRDLDVPAADVEIDYDAQGRPVAGGAWTEKEGQPPLLSITHAGGRAAAIAADPAYGGVGIDLEPLGGMRDDVETIAFDDEERRLLAQLPEASTGEWALRAWCAKEAVSKATGIGLSNGPRMFRVQEVDPDTGTMQVALTPDSAHSSVEAQTGCEQAFVYAASLLPCNSALPFH